MADHVLATPPPLPTQPRRGTHYAMAWAIAAGIALAYMAALAMRPDMLAQYLPMAPRIGAPETNEGQRAHSDALAEVKSLKDSLEQANLEIEKLKTELSGRSERDADLANRLSALEQPAKPNAAAQPVAPALAAPAPSAAAATPVTSVTKAMAKADVPKTTPAIPANTVVAEAAPALPAPAATPPAAAPNALNLKVINAAPAAPAATPAADTKPIETGSVAQPAAAAPIAFGPAVVKTAPKPIGIQLGSGDTIDSLRLNWSLLSDRHAGSLKNLEPRYTTGVDENGLTYDLLAGPVKSTAEAKRLCKDLAAKAVPCKIVDDFKGEAL